MDGGSDHGGTSGASHNSESRSPAPEIKKRNRIRFSCTTCRDKKLKCNRSLPCDQCEKRGISATCQFIPYLHPREDRALTSPSRLGGAKTRSAAQDATLQARLRHLEHLVSVLKLQRKESVEADAQPATGAGNGEPLHPADDPDLPGPSADASCFKLKVTAGPIVGQSRYVDSANWEAILDDITQLTHDLKTFDDVGDAMDTGLEPDLPKTPGPVLLLGSFVHAPLSELLAVLPPRVVTDRLVARFFQGKEPAWMMFHVPTFLNQYEEFWRSPQSCTYTWLALLFIMINHAAMFCLRGDEEVPGNLGSPMHVADTYRNRAAQCLAIDDYTIPGKFKVETLLLYFGSEYLRQHDAHIGTSVLMSVIVRLAMHMGLQRDPKHFKEVSPFEGEMRRRMWTLLTEIDELISFQFGLPANIQAEYYDTEPPRNLFDEDFDESTTELPPSRPETERTPTLYTIVKARIMTVFGEILKTINSRDVTPYEDVLALDKKLEAAHNSFTSILRMRSFSQSITDPLDLIMQRYWLDCLYQKARSVLHRKFLGVARMNNRYAYSRWTCLDAATKTLQHQYDIHMEIQPGGRLAKERWFVSSLSIHDFLLADMILCLELSYVLRMSLPGTAVTEARPDGKLAVLPKEQLLQILRTSRSIWQTSRKESAEANRAFKILTRMLAMSTGMDYESSPESSGSATLEIKDLQQPPSFQLSSADASLQFTQPTSLNLPSRPESISAAPSWASTVGLSDTPADRTGSAWGSSMSYMPAPGDATLDSLEGLIDPNLTSDWSLWDNQVHNANVEMLQIPWNAFFPPS